MKTHAPDALNDISTNPLIYGMPDINKTASTCRRCGGPLHDNNTFCIGMSLQQYASLFRDGKVPSAVHDALILDKLGTATASWSRHTYCHFAMSH